MKTLTMTNVKTVNIFVHMNNGLACSKNNNQIIVNNCLGVSTSSIDVGKDQLLSLDECDNSASKVVVGTSYHLQCINENALIVGYFGAPREHLLEI